MTAPGPIAPGLITEVVVVGAGGHGRVVLDALRAGGRLRAAGFLDAGLPAGALVDGAPVLGDDACAAALAAARPGLGFVLAIGDNFRRRAAAAALAAAAPGLVWVAVVHPAAVAAASASIGAGAFVGALAVVNPGARIGAHAIVNTAAVVEHDAEVGDFASLGPRAALGGGARVGACAHVGLGAAVRHGVTVGAHAVLGAQAYAHADCAPLAVHLGVPARRARSRTEDERYL